MAKKINYLPAPIRQLQREIQADIAAWKGAKNRAKNPQNPVYYLLQDLYSVVMDDSVLTSQIQNRIMRSVYSEYELVSADGKVNDGATEQLRRIGCMYDIIEQAIYSRFYGYSLLELQTDDMGKKVVNVLPRRNIVPDFGTYAPDVTSAKVVNYRELREFGKFIIEFNNGDFGLLEKCVIPVLFKQFTMSCWNEYCEICGIPPRYIKTQTNDSDMLNRAEDMMRKMGSAAWFIIDTEEELSFAQSTTHNGDVYKNLIHACNNEISLAICGAVIGQDTENGNRSKEAISVKILERLIEADKRLISSYMNDTVLPAFRAIGWLQASIETFRFAATENSEQLWGKTIAILPYKDVDNAFITEKFGIPVKDKPAAGFGLSHPAAFSVQKIDYDPFE